ncbi:PREDICTED: uncharacterized protein LOC108496141, partial [Lepidothrix coronata]|uniref:Uncharacterized protein LOC108496141 n=1 Tax=Lepidothrix coronata TaxID=321398 RepID=A0A6J0H0I3_9PASS
MAPEAVATPGCEQHPRPTLPPLNNHGGRAGPSGEGQGRAGRHRPAGQVLAPPPPGPGTARPPRPLPEGNSPAPVGRFGFMIKNSIVPKLENLPSAHSDQIISLRLPLHNKQHVVLFSLYAPTLQADPAEKDKFYTDLRCLIQKVPVDDKIIILGDFNARVGKNFEAWKGILGKHGVGSCNDNGRLLLEFCAEQQLTITNTIFQQKNSLKTTWMHPRSEHWHLIDYVLMRRTGVRDVHHTRVMSSAECQTDHRLVHCELPSDLRDAVIITLYKKKGIKSDCSNYHGITLLSFAGKILARILLNRPLPAIAEGILPESQCGFRANRSTTDMVFVLRQLQEKCREQNKGLYVTFVDLTKAFDTVSRKGLWQILEGLGCPPKFLKMIISLHEDQHGQVRYGNALSEPFLITNGVKQGCVLAPTLFTVFFSMM